MEYTDDQLTEWFYPDIQKPWVFGVVQIQGVFDCDEIYFSYYDDQGFHGAWISLDLAILNKTYHATESRIWRGLNFDPNAPKPKKGNKRKTMYVVMNHEPVIARPMASFSSLKNAQIYAENYFFAKIRKIRFRTPEHD